GFKTTSNLVTDEPLPGALRELVGATVTGWLALPPDVGWELETAVPHLHGPAGYWLETLKAQTASVLATYKPGGAAALTEHKVGNGRVLYLGFYPTNEQARALLLHLAGQLGLNWLPDLPEGLVAAQRGPYTILLNFTEQPISYPLNGQAVLVNSRDVAVIRR
ncbi:MAG: beta-galactosidase trimerization domain-containing protein, partial [Candidatus Promineifilaceae bacterium]